MFAILAAAALPVAADDSPRLEQRAALPPHVQLIVAAHRLDLKSVRALVAAGADVNGRLEGKWLPTLRAIGETELGGIPAIQWTPLHAVAAHALSADAPPAATGTAGAARATHPETALQIARLLLEQGADVQAKAFTGVTPLWLAVEQQNEPLTELFLIQGAQVNVAAGPGLEPPGDVTPLHVAVDHPALVRRLLTAGADPTLRNSLGKTPLYAADAHGERESQALLSEHIRNVLGQDPERYEFSGLTTQEERFQSMVLAAQAPLPPVPGLVSGHSAVVADPKQPGEVQPLSGEVQPLRTARSAKLILACYNRSLIDVRNLLADGADVNSRLPASEALQMATGRERATNVLALNWTPLLAVASSHNADAIAGRQIATLLLAGGADVNAQGWAGATPLFAAASRGDEPLVRLFLQHGAKVHAGGGSGLQGPFGQTPLHIAASSPEAVQQLLAAGADPARNDAHGWTPLDYAYSAGNKASIKLLEAALGGRPGEDIAEAFTIWRSKVARQQRELESTARFEAAHAARMAPILAEQARRFAEWAQKQDAEQANPSEVKSPTLAPEPDATRTQQ